MNPAGGRDLEAILSDRNEISDAVRQAVREAAGGYGVEILRADVKDLVFPGNLREIMNQVLETERRNEAKLIQARKEIEAQQLKARADNEAERQRLEARREQLSIELAADREKREAALQAEVEEAKALAEHPGLLKLRELKALGEMARRGAHFTVGLQADGLVRILEREREDEREDDD
ncbi:MAG: SPFH domain-containing protein [Myxococcales bacterium]|nr:SPFH domain-containing protein [Myxococcales bacterium]